MVCKDGISPLENIEEKSKMCSKVCIIAEFEIYDIDIQIYY